MSRLEDLALIAIYSAPFAGIAFLVTVLLTRPLIGYLRDRQIGKAIRADGPDHAAKSGTPTMGGLAILGGLLAAAFLLWTFMSITTYDGTPDLRFVVGASLAFGALGALDDRAGLARRRGDRAIGIGLTARRMISIQALVAVAIGAWMWSADVPQTLGIDPSAPVSRMGGPPIRALPAALDPLAHVWNEGGPVAAAAWIALSVVLLLGIVNGVNLSDGLDGLAAGLLIAAFTALGFVTTIEHRGPIYALCFAAAGACAGFLVYNRHPARIFMGNVGSMGMGGALGAAALYSGAWLLLPIIGAVFVAEVLSDIIQIGYFKLSGGKRIFRMAPLHHHFEMGGMPETTVVRRFWLAGALAGAAGVAVAIAVIA